MTTKIIEVNNLVPTAYLEREKLFLNENNEVEPIIKLIKEHYSSLTFDGMDGTTEQGRKTIKKVAAELNNKIKEIDAIGKSVTDILKAKPTRIDAGRKKIRDELGIVYETIRKPVVEWEAEQARIKAEEDARIVEEQRKKDEELARLRAQVESAKREEEIKAKAAENAKREAAVKIAEVQREAQKIKDEAERKEQQRIAEEKRKAYEEAKRLADIEHVRAVKNRLLTA